MFSTATAENPDQVSKLEDFSFRLIPLCATILVIFSIGGVLAYAVTQQPLPKDAVVGVSVTFLALGIFFGLGCLKIYHSTHKSDIPRLEPARSAYKRISECTGRLQNRVSKALGGSGRKEEQSPGLGGFFSRKASVKVHQLAEPSHDQAGRPDRRPNEQLANAQTQISNGSRGYVQTHPVVREDARRQENQGFSQQRVNPHGSRQYVPRTAPRSYMPLPYQQAASGHHTQYAGPPQSPNSSIGHTPPHMVATHMPQELQRVAYQHKHDSIPRLQRPPQRHNQHGIGQNTEPSLRQDVYPHGISGASGVPEQYGTHYPDLHINLAQPPEDLGQDALKDLETMSLGKLTYQIMSLAGMRKTREDGADNVGPVLPRSSSKTKAKPMISPLQSVRVERPAAGLARAKSHRAKHEWPTYSALLRTTNPFGNSVEAHDFSAPEPVLVKDNMARVVAYGPCEIIKQNCQAEQDSLDRYGPKVDLGRSLTTPRFGHQPKIQTTPPRETRNDHEI